MQQRLGIETDQAVEEVLFAAALLLALTVLVEQIEAAVPIRGMSEDVGRVQRTVDRGGGHGRGGSNIGRSATRSDRMSKSLSLNYCDADAV
jgi:hypothetical protein